MHLDLDNWSRGNSWLHRRDARAKLIVLIALLAGIGTTGRPLVCGVLIAAFAMASGLPLRGIIARAALVLPFTFTFAAVSILGGDWDRAQALLIRSLVSASAVVVTAGVTPLDALLRAAEWFGAPRLILQVMQFLYRYLFVLMDEAARTKWAAQSRGGFRWDAAGGAVAGLFASSYQRAEGIHMAMTARGFEGRMPGVAQTAFGWSDAALCGGVAILILIARLLWGV